MQNGEIKNDFYGLDGCKNIDEFVNKQIKDLKATDESFSSLFEIMFSVKTNVMFEYNDGNKICSLTYGEVSEKIKIVATNLSDRLSKLEKNSIVGLYMDNKLEWIYVFWAILMSGYRPILLNKRVNINQLESLLKTYNIKVTVSDEKIPSVINIDYQELLQDVKNVKITKLFD